ncbi:ATP-binding cassette domain-containing protein [Zobellia uliginosa]|uniref:ATP-binding cassette domain-containing protein n=1 Tax=Zobellia uliginosa TaxID=143224 RepID=UPI001C06D871|nr:ATP-binding cassette domain-containing protein [Zobellia uliginosa]MBU2947138.1 ATP-binding cassette domain-containing protein [Zobellia uliginosa]
MKLEIDNIELSFDHKRILYGIYLKAETGKITGLLGRNGCGKTSLLRILFGSLTPKYLNIRIDGVHQKRKLFKYGNIAYLPQHQLLPEGLKAYKAFNYFNADWQLFISTFPSFEKYRNNSVEELSSGELRVIETYLILNSNKKIILLDEPFSFIAPVYVEKMIALIEIKKQDTVIVITDHFYKEIMGISDTVYILKEGSCKQINSLKDLRNEGYII